MSSSAAAVKLVVNNELTGGNATSHIAREPTRDWSLGLITGHRLRVVVYLSVSMLLLYALQQMWPRGRVPLSPLEKIWSWMSLLWLGALFPGMIGLVGLMSFRYPTGLDDEESINTLVSWRIVSRGDNIEAVAQTIRRCQEEMAKTPLFPYVIEVVSDNISSSLYIYEQQERVRFVVVPKHYQTPNKSRFKARALHYALFNSPIPHDAWIVHLDEETQPTASGIKGICRMIKEEEVSNKLRIGQGAILYHRKWKRHPFLTLADNMRTGDDFARFYFQNRLGITLFGLHGSFIVVRNDIEKSIGFDFGPDGSITEDAFWALVAMQDGRRCRWVEGYMEEQSTQTVRDFLRQRRRWFQGLVKVVFRAPVKLRWRICLGVNTLLWLLTAFATLYTIGHLFYGLSVKPWVQGLANLSFASFITLYLIGLKANMDERGITNRAARIAWFLLQIMLIPIFSCMESIAVFWAVFRPASGFHVVKK